MMSRWRDGFLVPMVAFLVTVALIVGIGELLLNAGAPNLFTVADTKVHLAVLIALGLSVAILVVATVLAGNEKSER